MGTILKFSTAFHLILDDQTERTTQTLEDLLRACMIDFGGSWEDNLMNVDFSYNNIFHSSLGMAPDEALCRRTCRSPICWNDVDEARRLGPEMIEETTRKVKMIQEHMKGAQEHQKSYADKRRRSLEFKVGEKGFLKMSPTKVILVGKVN